MAASDDVAEFVKLSTRFLGVDLQRRRHTNSRGWPGEWPHPWRARLLTSKNERSEFRVSAYGTDIYEAMAALVAAVRDIDSAIAVRYKAGT